MQRIFNKIQVIIILWFNTMLYALWLGLQKYIYVHNKHERMHLQIIHTLKQEYTSSLLLC
jgi:hypothetical protein